MTKSAEDDSALVARVIMLERSDGQLPDDYKDNFDRDEAAAIAESLRAYLEKFSSEHNSQVIWTISENSVVGTLPDGTHLDIEVYGREAFDIQRWPMELTDGRLVFDLATKLDADHMITLARRFATQGNLED